MDEQLATCPICDQENTPMGTLGLLDWYRCRYCGIDYSRPHYDEVQP